MVAYFTNHIVWLCATLSCAKCPIVAAIQNYVRKKQHLVH